jgi:hypothetical protein
MHGLFIDDVLIESPFTVDECLKRLDEATVAPFSLQWRSERPVALHAKDGELRLNWRGRRSNYRRYLFVHFEPRVSGSALRGELRFRHTTLLEVAFWILFTAAFAFICAFIAGHENGWSRLAAFAIPIGGIGFFYADLCASRRQEPELLGYVTRILAAH